MTLRTQATLLALCLLFVALPALGADDASAEPVVQEAISPAAAAFARLKSLAGTWKGVTADDRAATLEVSLIAGGHTVMESYAMDGLGHDKPENQMYTLYHLDGDDLMLTHYCVSNNQPRMRADLSGTDPDVLKFELFDATNLSDPNAGHMYKATIHMVDADHLTTEWTFREKGADAYSVPVTYERAK